MLLTRSISDEELMKVSRESSCLPIGRFYYPVSRSSHPFR